MKFKPKALLMWVLSIAGLYLGNYLFNLVPYNIMSVIVTVLILGAIILLFLLTVFDINLFKLLRRR